MREAAGAGLVPGWQTCLKRWVRWFRGVGVRSGVWMEQRVGQGVHVGNNEAQTAGACLVPGW